MSPVDRVSASRCALSSTSATTTRCRLAADAIAACTMARLMTLSRPSPIGRGPPPSAWANSRNDPAIPGCGSTSPESLDRPGLLALDDLEGRGAVAVPQRRCRARHSPARRSSTTSRVPRCTSSRCRRTARRRTSRRSRSSLRHPRTSSRRGCTRRSRPRRVRRPSRKRVLSKVWIAMSSTSGWSMASRNPPKCGALKNSALRMPSRPSRSERTPEREQVRVVPPALADHEQPVVHLRGRDQLECLGEGSGQRLLTDDRQSAAQRLHRHRMVRLRDRHVHHEVGGHLVGELLERLRHRHVRCAEVGQSRLRRRHVEVGDTDQLGAVVLLDGAQPTSAHPAGADLEDAQRTVDSFCGRRALGWCHEAPSADPSNQPSGLRRSLGTSRVPSAGATHATAFAMTLRTSGWW